MEQHIYNTLSENQINQLCQRPKMDFKSVFSTVAPIIDKVETEGDQAVSYYTQKFDGVSPKPLAINPAQEEVSLDPTVKEAIDTAFDNIQQFHKAQLPVPMEVETMPGVRCQRVARAIERVGLYVPGGTAILPSTLMMLGIPAMLAGCSTIVVATPPKADDSVADEILYIAQKVGATTLLKAGGAQAVAAMALGTESVPKVDKIFGPGNQYVTAAKMMLQNSEAQIAIDMPAGPSEVLVIADDTAKPHFVAADLLSQAEHGADSQVVLVATEGFDLDACQSALDDQLGDLPRQQVARKAIDQSYSMVVEHLEEAFSFSNRYAPEHLIVQCREPEQWTDKIVNAGSVFLGHWTPESAGDYASGTNHTLPTYGYARMYSGVSVDSFLKQITIQQITEEGLQKLGPTIEKLAELEELQAHKNAVSIRTNELKNN
ncbi:histidinol dehydrogenase [Fodinibius salsisoli]|uniref:Histidinol dehydrogenase n=1 Tax=Fodinibius salsisoli TaxID=2820877 RepID=A0ABT3PS63_9BACT|nr:histidinol dehydrogenase [Fodinibius salsisoli]MCW9708671.1 histidinol dehydrogenase [Fodinibius salsisoli]